MQKQLKARPQWQRMFLHWFAQHRSDFLLQCAVGARTDRLIELWFPPLQEPARSALLVQVRRDNLNVSAEHGGVFYDLLLDLDAYPRRIGRRLYTDPLLTPEYQRNFDSLFELRHHLMYAPFLHWANSELSRALWLGLYVIRHPGDRLGSSYARLIYRNTDIDSRTHAEARLIDRLVRIDGMRPDPRLSQWDVSVLSLARAS